MEQSARETRPDWAENQPVEVMSIDITDLRGFYASPLGAVTRRFVGRAIDKFWGPLTGLRVLGLGYAPPYLSAIKDEGERTLAFMPANQGVVRSEEHTSELQSRQ